MHNYLQAFYTRIGTTFLLMIIAIGTAFSQTDYTAEADAAYARGGFYVSAQEYIKAYAKVKEIDEKGRIAFMIGESFRMLMDPGATEEWYDKAIGLRYGEKHPEVYLNYGEAMMAQQKFDDAIEWYMAYQENGGDQSVAEQKIVAADNDALALDEPPSRYRVENLLLLNSDAYDYGAGFSSDKGDQVVFASSRESSTGSGEDPITGESFMDLFQSEQDKKGRWSTPEPLNNTINTASNEGTVTFDKKYKKVYFTRCISDDENSFACDVYRADVMGNRYGPAEVVELIDRDANDSSQVGHPAFTVDNDFLMFVSDMPGGFGGKDLWYVSYDSKEDAFGSPVNFGPNVNTAGDEMFPNMRYDGALVYSSTGNGGMGGLDVFQATPGKGSMKFEKAVAMPYPINSSSDDHSLIYADNEDRGIFTSSRPGGKGKDDLYSFSLPEMEFCYRANVYDYDTGIPLMADLIVSGSKGGSWSLTADADGSISLCDKEIKGSTTYDVDVKFEGYIGTGDRFSTVGMTESTTFAREYFLKEVVLDEEYAMPLVLYAFNESALLIDDIVNSSDSLNYLLDIMERNASFVIQLESHTDSRGKDDYNMNLSQERAQTCVNYLVSRGIASDRLVAVGKGETMLLVSDSEVNQMASEEEKERGHQANRRTVFRILRFDYEPGQ
ncbi:MAG: OmpA family protein [Bacteroidetes bacterium]|jgi:peptidoglycan-associated lipoprotein|nr:OmpA family protein [Bacteroidota bacterium]